MSQKVHLKGEDCVGTKSPRGVATAESGRCRVVAVRPRGPTLAPLCSPRTRWVRNLTERLQVHRGECLVPVMLPCDPMVMDLAGVLWVNNQTKSREFTRSLGVGERITRMNEGLGTRQIFSFIFLEIA